jgi:hypothetical protein
MPLFSEMIEIIGIIDPEAEKSADRTLMCQEGSQ